MLKGFLGISKESEEKRRIKNIFRSQEQFDAHCKEWAENFEFSTFAKTMQRLYTSGLSKQQIGAILVNAWETIQMAKEDFLTYTSREVFEQHETLESVNKENAFQSYELLTKTKMDCEKMAQRGIDASIPKAETKEERKRRIAEEEMDYRSQTAAWCDVI